VAILLTRTATFLFLSYHRANQVAVKMMEVLEKPREERIFGQWILGFSWRLLTAEDATRSKVSGTF
jgi:hypothetical protein